MSNRFSNAAEVSRFHAIAAGSLPLDTRKTVLFVTKTREYGGAEKHLLQLTRRLIGCNIRLSILCLETDFYTERLPENRVDIIRPSSELKSFWNWFRVFRSVRPDVVVFVRAILWCYDWYIPIAAWLAGIPRRVSIAHLPPPAVRAKVEGRSIRCLWYRFRRAGHLSKLRVSASFEDLTICVSNAIRDALVREYGFPKDKTITIHNGVSLLEVDRGGDKEPTLRTRLGLSPQEFLLVCVARLSEQKRIDILLKAMARVLQDGVRCKCIIVGDGPLREQLSEQALSLGLSGHVFFEGFREDVRSYLRAGAVFVLTSDREGLPLSILEAMACGLPCIVTKVGGNPEVVTHGVNGLVVGTGSVDEVADAISYLVAHPHELAEMSKKARATVHREFDLEDRMAEIKRAILTSLSPG